ncbi:MAG: hypothetical protein FWF85_01880 [Clostridiales bacterium]|nr:hypothetical protein [Clostridiales bacterium]
MPISYIELERVAPQGFVVIVPENGTLVFDTIIADEGTMISYNINTGTITFNEAGFYYIDWFVAPVYGLTSDGSNWAVRTGQSQLTLIGSSHAKVSVTTGFAIIEAEAGETAQLINVSDGAINLSQAVKSKAGLVVYNVATQVTSRD